MDWASIIGIGLQFLGQKQASDASVGAASDYNEALIEAAKPKSVFDPTASAIWDEETQSYVLAPSQPMMGLFGANLQDAYRQRALIEDYMKDPESAARARFAKTDAALAPFRAKEGEGLLSRLLQSGTAGSSLGAEQVAAREAQNRLYDATRLEAERAGVQSDITNYINRSNLAAQNAATYGSIGQNLANLGMGLGSNAYTAAAQGGQGLMNAQAASGFGYGQIPYAIGQNLMGYKKDPYANLNIQSNYAVGSQAPANLYNRF
jgi:hypothetical protein